MLNALSLEVQGERATGFIDLCCKRHQVSVDTKTSVSNFPYCYYTVRETT